MVAIVVVLSASAAYFLLGLGGTTDTPGTAGVSIDRQGEVLQVQRLTLGTANSVIVRVNGTDVGTLSGVGDTLQLTGDNISAGESIQVIARSEAGSEALITEQRVSTSLPVADIDGDGLRNSREKALGTDPTLVDTDGDSVDDHEEVLDGTDPVDDTSYLPHDGLVARYRFAGSTQASVGPNLFALGATYTTGRAGNSETAIDLQTNQAVATGVTGLGLDGSSATISVWLQNTNELRRSTVFRFSDEHQNRVLNAHIPWDNGNIYFDVGTTPSSSNDYGRYFTSLDAQYHSGWHHFVFRFDTDANTAAIYVDGTYYGGGTVTEEIQPIRELLVADKIVDDISVYDRALSVAEIQRLYDTPPAT
jgi:hypothetical protein